MASGWAGDPVYGQPLTTPLVAPALTTPRTQTVLNTLKLRRETISIEANDDHYIQAGPSAGDTYHE
jgi:hypothetical protein